MGDHRTLITIKVEDFHGVTRQTKLNINYCPSDCCDMDERVTRFFHEVYTEGMINYRQQMADYYKQKDEQEERERLATLIAKYPDAIKDLTNSYSTR